MASFGCGLISSKEVGVGEGFASRYFRTSGLGFRNSRPTIETRSDGSIAERHGEAILLSLPFL